LLGEAFLISAIIPLWRSFTFLLNELKNLEEYLHYLLAQSFFQLEAALLTPLFLLAFEQQFF